MIGEWCCDSVNGYPQFTREYYIQMISEDVPAGVSMVPGTPSVTVFPNPFDDIVHFSQPQHGRLVVTDITGKPVLELLLNGATTVKVDDLSPGIYVFCLSNAEGLHYFRAVRE